MLGFQVFAILSAKRLQPGKKRGMMMSGGVVNTERAAITVLDEFRSGKIGRISLERPHTAVQDSSQQL